MIFCFQVNKVIKKRVRRILIIRLGSIGDILLTTPLIRMIKKQIDGVEIDFLIKRSFVPLVQENPHINQIIQFNGSCDKVRLWNMIRHIRNSGYDAILDLQNNQRSFLIRCFSGVRIQRCFHPKRIRRFLLVYFKANFYGKSVPVSSRYLKTLAKWGIVDDGAGLEFFIDRQSENRMIDRLRKKQFNKEKILVLAPGAAHNTKRWPITGFAEAGNFFAQRGMSVIIVGGQGDTSLSEELVQLIDFPVTNYSGQLSLSETGALIKHSELIITNDTGVAHMGAAFRRKLVVIFGPTTHHFGFLPFRTDAIVIEKSLSCRPCSYHGSTRCPKDHFNCMKQIRGHEVIEAALKLLKSESVHQGV